MEHSIRFALSSLVATLPLLLMSTSLHAQQNSPTPTRLEAGIDSIIQTDVIGRGVTGASVVITRGSETLLDRSWGLADLNAKRPVAESTTYRVGSMSKQFTAALLLKLVDRGSLALNDTVGRYLTGLKPEWNGLTIEHLLNHTSGVPREFREVSRVGEHLPTDSLIALAARVNAPTAPAGTTFTYSNTGYMLLAALVEKLYGKPYGAALRDEIARPLGLETLGWCGDLEAAGHVAKGYTRLGDGSVNLAPFIHPSQMLAGGICSNAGDIARWNRALHGGEVLSAASYAAMITPRGVAASRSVPYGFGLYVRATPGGGTVIVHDGATPGYAGENVWYPAESLSVTMLTNTTGVLRADLNLTEAMGRLALGRPSDPTAEASPAMAPHGTPATSLVGDEARRKFVGDYEMAPGVVFKVTFEDGDFHVTPPRGPQQLLVHESGATYAIGRSGSTTTTTFLANPDGEVVGMLTRQNGAERHLRKIR